MKPFVLSTIITLLCCICVAGLAQSRVSPSFGFSTPNNNPLTSSSNQSDCDELCAAFKKVFAARGNDFASLRGEQRSVYPGVDPVWEVTFEPTAFQGCALQKKSDGDYEYSCYSPAIEPAEVDEKFRKMAKSLQTALPTGCRLVEGSGTIPYDRDKTVLTRWLRTAQTSSCKGVSLDVQEGRPGGTWGIYFKVRGR